MVRGQGLTPGGEAAPTVHCSPLLGVSPGEGARAIRPFSTKETSFCPVLRAVSRTWSQPRFWNCEGRGQRTY